MIEPSNPLVLLIPGSPTVSLKNERKIVRFRKNGKEHSSLVPSARVKKFINNTRAAIRRQLPDDWKIKERGVAVVLEMHLYYNSASPRSDIDNFYTTVQECLQETLVENDKQIEYFLALRKRSRSKMGQHSLLFFWETTGFTEKELITFLIFKEKYNYAESNQLGFTGTDEGTRGGTRSGFDLLEVPDPF